MNEERDEIAARIACARFPCKERTVPCPNCDSMVFQGCVFLAEAVLTPRVEPQSEEIYR